MRYEIVRVAPEAVAEFVRGHERAARSAFYGFPVIWHEQAYDLAAMDGERVAGTARIRVAASLAHVERVVVAPEHRKRGVGRALLASASDAANYYNCHKMTVIVPLGGAAQRFFERCDFHQEAVLPQHTFKLDMAVLRKFLL